MIPEPPPATRQPSGTPPTATPSAQPQTSPIAGISDGYSGIDPAAMDDFEHGLGRAEDALGRNEQIIDRTLRQLNLDTSGLGALREMRNWLTASRPDLRRRSETIRAQESEWSAGAGVPGGLNHFDETLYGKAAHNPDVYAAVTTVTQAAEKGEIDEKTLKALEKRKGDPAFAAGLMNALGAVGFRELMAKTVDHGDDRKVTRLQAALGAALGTASSRLSPAWRDQLTPPATANPKEAYAVALALKNGKADTSFLVAAARKLDAWDRARSKLPASSPDVMVPLMEALSENAAAAQDFFAKDATALKHFLTERYTQDGGKALGKALEAAMLTFRDHDGSPDQPSRGYLSALLASEFVHLQAQRIDAGDPPESLVPAPTTGRILAGYIIDINRVAQSGAGTSVPAVWGADNPSIPQQDPWGAQFDLKELRQVMQEAFVDSSAFAPVVAAQTAFSSLAIDYGAAEKTAGHGDHVLMTNAKRIGAGFALITDAAGLAKIEEGAELDKTQQRNVKVLTAMVNTGLAIPQSGTWPVTNGVVGAWTGMIEDSIEGEAESKARSDANVAVNETRTLLHDLTAQAMLKHGLFGTAASPANTHPWASLEGLSKGGDPRANPNNFLEDDGQTLMSRNEMISKGATNGIGKDQRLQAYERWLHEGPAGKTWQEVEDRLDLGFKSGFSQYQP
ncbi:hypothetical protein [Microbispora sp. NPDC046933]|uniref:hypothetical protein n=1 Tax=Microbispora sp. NPDC046933 TaxID=3155618 RepID=UPI0033CA8331